jgi:hypothetical protein
VKLRRLSAAGVLACSCAAGCAGETSTGRDLPHAFQEPVPLPGCERFEYQVCDVRAPACLENLAQIAACLRTGAAGAPSPAVSFASEDEARQLLLASLEQTPPPVPDYFELVLTQLGLSQPSAFEPAVSAARLASRWAAFYRRDVGDVVVIDHTPSGATRDPLETEALVLHELIHALQDRDQDLDAFARRYQTDSDGNFRGSSVIEGEAQLQQLRFYAALGGIDVGSVDWAAELANQRDAAEERLFAEPDRYSASLLGVPYAHGTEFVAHVWDQSGPDGVRALLDAPPRDMREILAQVWGDDRSEPAKPGIETAPVDPADALFQTWSTLGAWGVYLFFRPRLATREEARALALAWRADRLEAFSFGAGQVAGRWWIQLADAESATRLLASIGAQPGLRARALGAQLRLLSTSSDELPPPGLDP